MYRPCVHPGCDRFTDSKHCIEHALRAAPVEARKSASRRGYDRRWRREREMHLRRYPTCEYVDPQTGRVCGRYEDENHVHHVVKIRNGGARGPKRTVCAEHHPLMEAQDLARWNASRQAVPS